MTRYNHTKIMDETKSTAHAYKGYANVVPTQLRDVYEDNAEVEVELHGDEQRAKERDLKSTLRPSIGTYRIRARLVDRQHR